MNLLIATLVTVSCFQLINAGGQVRLKLVTYSNPTHRKQDGTICDPAESTPSERECDNFFHLCLAQTTILNATNPSLCTMGSKRTGVIVADNFTFADSLGNLIPNPHTYDFNKWEGSLSILTSVLDDDKGKYEDVDRYNWTGSFLADYKERVAKNHMVALPGVRSSLSVEISVYCKQNYFIPSCNEYCVFTNDSTGHHDCDYVRGKKSCLDGWYGPNCLQKKKDCTPRNDKYAHYKCDFVTGEKICLPGWKNVASNCTEDGRAQVSCSPNYMRVEIDKEYYNATHYSKINLRDTTCNARYTNTKIILDGRPEDCGSIKVPKGDYITYHNYVFMKAKPSDGNITRWSNIKIGFSCSYNKSALISSREFQPKSTMVYFVRNFGLLRFIFNMFPDSSYRTPYSPSQYPVKPSLTDVLYYELQSDSTDPDLVLLIDQCYVTPTSFPDNSYKFMIIEDRCPSKKSEKEQTVRIVNGDAKRKRFTLASLKFVNSDSVYVHCVVFVCNRTSSDERCTGGCPRNRVNPPRVRRDVEQHRARRDIPGMDSEFIKLDVGPIQLKQNNKEVLATTTIILIAGMGVLAIAVLLMFVKMQRSKSKRKRPVKEIGLDNAPKGKQYSNLDEPA